MDIEELRKKLRGEPEKRRGFPGEGLSKRDIFRMTREGEGLDQIHDHPNCRCVTKPIRHIHPAHFADTKIPCEGHFGPCGKTPTAPIPAMTAYPDPEDNKPVRLCEQCAEAYTNDWQERWDEYRSGLF